MGVPFKIIIYAPGEATAKAAIAAAFERIEALNAILSDYDRNSELSRLARDAHPRGGVAVSDDLWHVLAEAQELAHRTDGAFDVTVGPYVRLWRRARRQKTMPAADRLQAARETVGYRWLELDAHAHRVRLLKPDMRIDLGGIAMGYAVDEALRTLHKRGITHALIDASGDIGTPSRRIALKNAAVTTSGDAFQHVVIDGRRYSHIVDPRTGLGLTDRSGVTVIAGDCTTADSLATAVSVLGPEAGLQLVESTPGAAAFIVRATDSGIETFESSRFAEYVIDEASAK